MQVIEPIGNNVIVQFVDEIYSERFVNRAASGILLPSVDGNQSQSPRWAKVTHVGPTARELKAGDHVLISAGKWTPGFDFQGQRYWKTDEDQVVGTADEPGTTY